MSLDLDWAITVSDGRVTVRIRLDGQLVGYLRPRLTGRSWGTWWAQDSFPPHLEASMLERWDELVEAGLPVHRWWCLWECRDCGARPWEPCLHLVTGKPIKWSHRGRKPL